MAYYAHVIFVETPIGRGKRGGSRVIYFWRVSESQILMLAIYSKGEKVDLTPADKKVLRKIVETWK